MHDYIAKTFAGLEPLLAQELKDLGAQNIQKLTRAVAFQGDESLMYRCNLSLRTALRIIQPIAVETVQSANQLYEFARAINWTRFFNPNDTFAINSVIDKNPNFNNNMIVSLKVKDAIVDQFRDLKGDRPNVDKENPSIRIEVHLQNDRCTLAVDTSGDSLHKRGYRIGGHAAPLNEIVGAALVLWSGWNPETPLVDFMCGTGTILTEAAMIGANISPNLNRDKFSFQNWKNFDRKLYDKVWLEEKAKARPNTDLRLYGNDLNYRACVEARETITNAGADDYVRITNLDYRHKDPPKDAGMIITNPPYGERLKLGTGTDFEMFDFYKELGDVFKQKYKGWTAWVLSGNLDAMKKVGLKASQKHHVYNGALECTYNKYEMY
jgi:putative N6-adenine-specific DNA methylase